MEAYGDIRDITPATLMGYMLVHGYKYQKTYIPTYAATMTLSGIEIKIPTHNSTERDSLMLRAIRLLGVGIDKSPQTIMDEMRVQWPKQ